MVLLQGLFFSSASVVGAALAREGSLLDFELLEKRTLQGKLLRELSFNSISSEPLWKLKTALACGIIIPDFQGEASLVEPVALERTPIERQIMRSSAPSSKEMKLLNA